MDDVKILNLNSLKLSKSKEDKQKVAKFKEK